MTNHTRPEKIGGDSINFCGHPSRAKNRYDTEYVAITEAATEMIWLQTFMKEFGQKCDMGTLYNDSQSGIFLAKNPAFHSKTKHIQVKYYFIRYLFNDEQMKLEKICRSQNLTDILTKGATVEKLRLCTTSIDLLAWKQKD